MGISNSFSTPQTLKETSINTANSLLAENPVCDKRINDTTQGSPPSTQGIAWDFSPQAAELMPLPDSRDFF